MNTNQNLFEGIYGNKDLIDMLDRHYARQNAKSKNEFFLLMGSSGEIKKLLDRGLIRSSPRYGLSSPYRLTKE